MLSESCLETAYISLLYGWSGWEFAKGTLFPCGPSLHPLNPLKRTKPKRMFRTTRHAQNLTIRNKRKHMENESSMIVVGIDPGLDGALAALAVESGARRVISIWDMPTKPRDYGKGAEIDGAKLAGLLKRIAGLGYQVRVCVEGQNPRNIGSPKTVWSLGHSTGVIAGCLAALGFQVTYADPGKWKRELGLSADKELSLALARKLYSDQDSELTRNDRAEALLIAHYASGGGPAPV